MKAIYYVTNGSETHKFSSLKSAKEDFDWLVSDIKKMSNNDKKGSYAELYKNDILIQSWKYSAFED